MKIKRNLIQSAIILNFILLSALSAFAQSQSFGTRVLLIPLDDRPPCLQFPIKMGLIGNAEVVAPPLEMLGRFTEAGKSDQIIDWIKTQNLNSFDAAIISIDMLSYGGLVAMRTHQTDDKTALKRLEFLRTLRKLAPKIKIYGSSVIMRLAPTGTGDNEAYRESLAKWAEISDDPAQKNETLLLEQKIPAEALADYKAARVRDLKINKSSIELVRDKVIDYLILSQDDAKPKGIHITDREKLIALTKKMKLTGKIAVQPGADEVSMLLLARAFSDKYNFHPKIKAVYSSENVMDKVMPFEDRPLKDTVSFDIKATGAKEVKNEAEADLLFYVFASRKETDRTEKFVSEIERKVNGNKGIIVGDIDPKGDIQGGDILFTEELGKRHIFPKLYSYASWNTAGNTVGTTLPQGVIFALAKNKLLKSEKTAAGILTAQNWFTVHRVIDDYYFHHLVRAKAKEVIARNKWNSFRLSDQETVKIEDYSLNLLKVSFDEFAKPYFSNLEGNLNCEKPSGLIFKLPWNRTFEAEIDFTLKCSKVN